MHYLEYNGRGKEKKQPEEIGPVLWHMKFIQLELLSEENNFINYNYKIRYMYL